MLTTETVNIRDVEPPEDEYGNLYLSRDYSLPENIAYIDELAHSIKTTGLHEPPVLVRDGGIFRIKTGNTRVMAMRKLGIEKFEAIIDEGTTPDDVLKLILAAHGSNTKKTYHPVEAGKIDQQLFAFCPDDYIAETMSKPIDEVRRARRGHKRAVEIAGDEATQLTWEHFAYMDEFDGDDEAINSIINAPAEKLESVHYNLVTERAKREDKAAALAKLREAGVEIVEEVPDDFFYYALIRNPESSLIPTEDIALFCAIAASDGVMLYKKTEAEKEDTELQMVRDVNKAKMEVVKAARLKFFCENWQNKGLGILAHEAFIAMGEEEAEISSEYISYSDRSFLADNDLEYAYDPWIGAAHMFNQTYDCGVWHDGDIDLNMAFVFTWLTDVLKQDGYVPPQEEIELYDAFVEILNTQKAAEEQEEAQTD